MNATVVAPTAPRVEAPERSPRGAGRGPAPDDGAAFDRQLANVLGVDAVAADPGHDWGVDRDRDRRRDDRDDRVAETVGAVAMSTSMDHRPTERPVDRPGGPTGDRRGERSSVGSTAATSASATSPSGTSASGTADAERSGSSPMVPHDDTAGVAAGPTPVATAGSEDLAPGPRDGVGGSPTPDADGALALGAVAAAAPGASDAHLSTDGSDVVVPTVASPIEAEIDPAVGRTTGPTIGGAGAATGDPATGRPASVGVDPSDSTTTGSSETGTSETGAGQATATAATVSEPAGPDSPEVSLLGAAESVDGSGAAPSDGSSAGDATSGGTPTRADGAVVHRTSETAGHRVDAGVGRPVAATNDPRPPLGADAAQRARLVGLGSNADLEMDLGDEGLGPLRLHASAVGSTVNLHLSSTDPAVRELLARHAGDLRQDLDAAGVDLGTLDVGAHPDRREADGTATDDGASAPGGRSGRGDRGDAGSAESRSSATRGLDPADRRGSRTSAGERADRSLDLRL